MSENWDNWCSIIRACTLTSKKPLSVFELNRDVAMMEGTSIPFKKFNYRNLEEMLRNIKGLQVFSQDGKIVVRAMATEATAHIQSLVSRQKSKKKTSKTRQLPKWNNFNYNNGRARKLSDWKSNQSRTAPSYPPSYPPAKVQQVRKVPKQTVVQQTPIIRQVPQQTVVQQSPVRPIPSLLDAFQILTRNKVPHSTAVQQKKIKREVTVGTSLIQNRLIINTSNENLKTKPVVENSIKSIETPTPTKDVSSSFDDDSRLQLLKFTVENQLLEPVYKDCSSKDGQFYSLCTVGQKKYNSYPTEAKTKNEAQKIAAAKALKDLSTKKEEVKSQPTTPTSPVSLPSITTSPLISPVVHESIKPKSVKYQHMDQFYLNVHVTYSVTDIWGVIVDEEHSDQLEILAQNMRNRYSKIDEIPSNIEIGSYYAVFDEEWHRTRCISYNEKNDQITVLFIDRGDEDVFPIKMVRTLYSEFCVLPAQAVRVSLHDLEIFEDLEEADEILDKLLVENILLVKNRGIISDGKNESYISAELYDISTKNLNIVARDQLLEIVNPTFYMKPEHGILNAFITNISMEAIYVQLKDKGKQFLDKLIDNITKEFLKVFFKNTSISNFDTTKMCMAKNRDDETWYRCKIKKIINESEAQVFLIDVGNCLNVKKSELVSEDDLPPILALYPSQAIQVNLHKISKITFDEKMLNRLKKLAPKTESFLMKVVGTEDNIPVCGFYKRNAESDLLSSLNDTIIVLNEQKDASDVNNNSGVKKRTDRFGYGFPLSSPPIPPIGKEFDIFVTMAAHPGNFTVQPLSSAQKLEEMMNELTYVCNNYNGPPVQNITAGKMYAARYEGDDKWYRGYVSKLSSDDTAIVYYCDFGDYNAINIKQLLPLEKKFFELPYQAIKGKLCVNDKINKNWTIQDSLRFSKLTVEKEFVSVVNAIEYDNILHEMILVLELIDTSTADNVYISKVMSNKE